MLTQVLDQPSASTHEHSTDYLVHIVGPTTPHLSMLVRHAIPARACYLRLIPDSLEKQVTPAVSLETKRRLPSAFAGSREGGCTVMRKPAIRFGCRYFWESQLWLKISDCDNRGMQDRELYRQILGVEARRRSYSLCASVSARSFVWSQSASTESAAKR
jgi:hypothetical protein